MTMSEYLQPSVLGVATATLSVVRAVAKKVTEGLRPVVEDGCRAV